jgi:hypothetical protein
MASGQAFEVRHPEMAELAQGALKLFTFVSDVPNKQDRWDMISLMLMERISFLQTPTQPESHAPLP